MKKLFYGTASLLLGAAFLFSPISVFAEDYTPFSIQVGGTGATTLEEAKENLEIPEIVQTAGNSETVVMSQKAVTDAIASGSGGGIVVTQDLGTSTNLVMSQNAVKTAIEDSIGSKIQIEQNLGNYIDRTISQNTITENFDFVQSQINERPTTATMNSTIENAIQNNISQTTGQDPTKSISQKAFSESLLTPQAIFDMIYPVGSIYMSINSSNPEIYLPNTTWIAWGQGRVPLGMGSNGTTNYTTVQATNNSNTETHTLTTSQMPVHDGHVPNASYAWGEAGESTYVLDKNNGAVFQHATNRPYVVRAGNEMCIRSNPAGNGNAHNNMQPYITCYMWLRTA